MDSSYRTIIRVKCPFLVLWSPSRSDSPKGFKSVDHSPATLKFRYSQTEVSHLRNGNSPRRRTVSNVWSTFTLPR